jgi:hypothetical protein
MSNESRERTLEMELVRAMAKELAKFTNDGRILREILMILTKRQPGGHDSDVTAGAA